MQCVKRRKSRRVSPSNRLVDPYVRYYAECQCLVGRVCINCNVVNAFNTDESNACDGSSFSHSCSIANLSSTVLPTCGTNVTRVCSKKSANVDNLL